MIRITITDVNPIIAGLCAVGAMDPIARALDGVAADVIPVAQDYPAPPPNSTYVRTDDLKRGWAAAPATVRGRTATVTIGNSVEYSPYVQGPDDQAPIHQGRWQTTDLIAAAFADRAGADVARAIDAQIAQVLP